MNVVSSLLETLAILRHRWTLGFVILGVWTVFLGPPLGVALVASDQLLSLSPILVQLALIVPAALALAVSESVIVVGIRDHRRDTFTWRGALSGGMRRLRSALAVSLAGIVAGSVASLIAWQVPGRLFAEGWFAAAAITIAIGFVPYVAFQITRIAWMQFAIRMAVIEERAPLAAALGARRFLRGRLAHCLRLVITTGALRLGLALVCGVVGALVLIGLRALAAGTAFSLSWPVGVGVMVLFSVAPVAIGNVVESSLWTLTFLDARASD